MIKTQPLRFYSNFYQILERKFRKGHRLPKIMNPEDQEQAQQELSNDAFDFNQSKYKKITVNPDGQVTITVLNRPSKPTFCLKLTSLGSRPYSFLRAILPRPTTYVPLS